MVTGVIYLDIDDEITSAASRIRSVDGRRVAVVLPYGSRVATSRINFRLLARDAVTHEKRLSVVAGDAATRALAASAGLSVFASVQEYEAAIESEGTAEEVEATVTLVGPADRITPSDDSGDAPVGSSTGTCRAATAASSPSPRRARVRCRRDVRPRACGRDHADPRQGHRRCRPSAGSGRPAT